MNPVNDTRKIVPLSDAESPRIAEVLRAAAGQALEVRLDGRNRPVLAHLDTVTPLAAGDAVLVEPAPEGIVVTGRLRRAGELPAAPVRLDAEGRLVLEQARGVVIRAEGCTLELRRDGAVVLDGKTILSVADGLHRLQGATIELN